jgi:excisionase family DNA binding protein
MAAALDIAVLAEGVETLEQAAWLASVDCEYAQGFGLARPAPAEVIEPLLRDGLPAERIAWSLDGAGRPPVPTSAPESTVPLSEAAEALGISASTLRRWADTGKLQTIRTPGGHRRFPVSEVRRLSTQASAHARGAVQSTELPQRPIHSFADLLDLGPGTIVVAATSIYSRGRPGWFGSAAGSVATADWVTALAQAARDGAYERTVESTRRLLTLADFAGTSLLERHWALERVRDSCLRQLRDRGASQPDLVEVRRLFLHLGHCVLAGRDDG